MRRSFGLQESDPRYSPKPLRENVAIFWDYENVAPPSGISGYVVAEKIRSTIRSLGGAITTFKGYLELSAPVTSIKSIVLRSELQSSGVSLIDCPHPDKRKDVVDKMMLVDILAWAMDNPAPATVCLVSGDRDFAYCLSTLRNRGYTVALMAPTSVHGALRAQADVTFEWTELFPPVVLTPPKRPDTIPAIIPLMGSPGGPSMTPVPTVQRSTIGIQCDPTPLEGLPTSLSSTEVRVENMTLKDLVDADAPTEYGSEGEPQSTIANELLGLPSTQESKREEIQPPGSILQQPQSWATVAAWRPTQWALSQVQPPVVVPPHFADLVAVLREARSEGFMRPTRNYISTALAKRNAWVYEMAGVRGFKAYIELAESENIVTLGPMQGVDFGMGRLALNQRYHIA